MPLQPQPLPHLIQTGLPFWYRLTQVVLENRPLNGCSSSSSRSWKLNKHNSRTFQEAWEPRFQLPAESTHRFRSRWSDRVSSPRRSCRRSRCRRRRAGAASRRRWTTRTCIYLAHRWSPGSPARHSTDRLDSRRADHTPSTHARTHAHSWRWTRAMHTCIYLAVQLVIRLIVTTVVALITHLAQHGADADRRPRKVHGKKWIFIKSWKDRPWHRYNRSDFHIYAGSGA